VGGTFPHFPPTAVLKRASKLSISNLYPARKTYDHKRAFFFIFPFVLTIPLFPLKTILDP
jgi:hypothetical protein